MRHPASQGVPTANDQRVSNFDQFFVGLPISVYQRPRRTSVVPPCSRRCGPLCAGIPSRQCVSSVPAPNIGLGRFRLKQEIHIVESSLPRT